MSQKFIHRVTLFDGVVDAYMDHATDHHHIFKSLNQPQLLLLRSENCRRYMYKWVAEKWVLVRFMKPPKIFSPAVWYLRFLYNSFDHHVLGTNQTTSSQCWCSLTQLSNEESSSKLDLYPYPSVFLFPSWYLAGWGTILKQMAFRDPSLRGYLWTLTPLGGYSAVLKTLWSLFWYEECVRRDTHLGSNIKNLL